MRQTHSTHPRCLIAVAGLALIAAGCRQDMYDQPRYEPQEASTFFKDGKADRPLVAGTVPRLDRRNEPRDEQYDRPALANDLGDLTNRQAGGPRPRADLGERLDREATGVVDGKLVETIPIPVDHAFLERGRQRYQIFCTPCHGATGDGRGMIVRRGFSPPPPFYGKRPRTGESAAATFYEDLRDAPVGHFFEVITHGHGAMYSYASRVPPRDRWAITAYIRALQLSQHAEVADLPPQDRDALPRTTP